MKKLFMVLAILVSTPLAALATNFEHALQANGVALTCVDSKEFKVVQLTRHGEDMMQLVFSDGGVRQEQKLWLQDQSQSSDLFYFKGQGLSREIRFEIRLMNSSSGILMDMIGANRVTGDSYSFLGLTCN